MQQRTTALPQNALAEASMRWRLRASVVLCAAIIATTMAGCRRPPDEVIASQTVTLKLADGALRGGVLDDVAVFKNIPYAAPPIGPLRWRSPQPARPWREERDATRYGNDCMQNRQSWDRAMSPQPLSEDCLYLNVWTPRAALEDGGGRAVLVWIHGGAYASGSGSSPLMVGDRLAREDVVVVTFNYRLGRFGFFAHPALRESNGDEPLGNYGTQDQIAALRWVQRNIERFGGDPARVTIFGESAGGDSVQQLMLSPQAKGLFAQAIAQSAGGRTLLPLIDRDLPGLPSAQTRGIAWADSLKLKNPDADALRAVPTDQVKGDLSLIEWEKERWSGVMIDGQTVLSNVIDGFAEGRQARVPFVVGANGYELGSLPGIFRNRLSKEQFGRFGADLDKVKAAYPDADAFDVGFISDFSFVEPARTIARHASKVQPVFLYRFNYVIESKRKDLPGAPHFSDVPLVFGYLDETGQKIGPQDRAMSRVMQALWTNFAKSGIPAAGDRAAWTPYSAQSDQLYEITPDGASRMAQAGAPWLDAIARYVTADSVAERRVVARPLDPACASLKALDLAASGMTGRVTEVASLGPGDVLEHSLKGIPPLPVEDHYCRVRASLSAGPGSSIGIEVWLPPPDRWNGKFVGAGNSGYGGDLTGPNLIMTRAVRQGYAAAGSDTGHQGDAMGSGPDAGARWALNAPERVVDYGHRAEHLTAVAAKKIISAHYGRAPSRAYFQGCSNGGRSALMAARRYPDDYDGIIAGAPAAAWSRLLRQFTRNSQAAHGDPEAALDPAALSLLRDTVVAHCDAVDGLEDGLLEDPRRCAIDLDTLQCAGAKSAACLSAKQVATAKTIYGGVRDPAGRIVHPGMPLGGESVQWHDWITGPRARQKWFVEEYYRYMVLGDAQWTLQQWQPRDAVRADQVATANLDADDPDLSAFVARGGKLILHHGWDDGAITPLGTIAYYEAVREALGDQKADDAVRLFLAPGVAHCGGGPGPNAFDLLAPLDRWVEQGEAPEQILAIKYRDDLAPVINVDPGPPLRTRPLCAYPKVARWKGEGSPDAATSFTCVTP